MSSQILAMREDMRGQPETPTDWLRALKKVRSSVRRHGQIHGKWGYLDFIIAFA